MSNRLVKKIAMIKNGKFRYSVEYKNNLSIGSNMMSMCVDQWDGSETQVVVLI